MKAYIPSRPKSLRCMAFLPVRVYYATEEKYSSRDFHPFGKPLMVLHQPTDSTRPLLRGDGFQYFVAGS